MRYIPAREHGPADNYPIQRIVMHGTVTACVPGGALAVARMFAVTEEEKSVQYVVDPSTAIRCLPDSVVAWGAPPNTHAIHVEQCDPQAGNPKRWQDARHQSMLRLAAKLVAGLCKKYDIPIRKISSADLLAGRKGICGHRDVSEAWHQTDHVDPGPDYPWAQFLALVEEYANPKLVPPVLKPGVKMYTLWKVKGVPGDFASDGSISFWLRTPKHLTDFQYQMKTFYGSPNTTVFEYDAADIFEFFPAGFKGPVPNGWNVSADGQTIAPPGVAA